MADEWGVDGIMLNEHHNAPFCMQARTNMFGAILAAVTKRAKSSSSAIRCRCRTTRCSSPKKSR